MRRSWSRCLSLLFCLLTAVPGLAQESEGAIEKDYVMCYFLIGLTVTLGLVAICRPSKRSKEVRRPDA